MIINLRDNFVLGYITIGRQNSTRAFEDIQYVRSVMIDNKEHIRFLGWNTTKKIMEIIVSSGSFKMMGYPKMGSINSVAYVYECNRDHFNLRRNVTLTDHGHGISLNLKTCGLDLSTTSLGTFILSGEIPEDHKSEFYGALEEDITILFAMEYAEGKKIPENLREDLCDLCDGNMTYDLFD